MWKKIKPYIISVLIALAVGGVSALLTKNNMDIYNTIRKPLLAPPSIVFPIVWGVLYVLMGIGSAMVYNELNGEKLLRNSALKTYVIQLAVNFLWSILFFNLRAFLISFVWLLLLLVLVLVMSIQFIRIKPVAGYLQIPYILWIGFAGYLNFMIWLLN